jgi:heme exporter protein B
MYKIAFAGGADYWHAIVALRLTFAELLRQVVHIIGKELKLELRQKTVLYGILLYIASVIFLIYMLNPEADGVQWGSLLWLNCVFLVVQTTSKHLNTRTKGQWQYMYTLYNPQAYIVAQIIYNLLLMTILSLLALVMLSGMVGFMAIQKQLFVGIYLLGVASFTILFTFLTQLVARINSNSALLAVVGLPLVFPLIIIVSDLSIVAFQPMLTAGWNKFLYAGIALDIVMLAMSVILIPFVWKD